MCCVAVAAAVSSGFLSAHFAVYVDTNTEGGRRSNERSTEEKSENITSIILTVTATRSEQTSVNIKAFKQD